MREQILNPKTNRWVFTDTVLGKKLVKEQNDKKHIPNCPFDKILQDKECVCKDEHKINNPITDRCVLKDGKIGQEILQKRKIQEEIHIQHPITNTNNQGKKCPRGKIVNPLTNRCVKKNGV